MIKILGKKGQYHAVVTAENGEILSSTEPEKTKQSVYKNIASQCHQFGGSDVWVHDETNNGKAKLIKAFVSKGWSGSKINE